jgi:hypothetical protein
MHFSVYTNPDKPELKIEDWDLRFICNLLLEIWDFIVLSNIPLFQYSMGYVGYPCPSFLVILSPFGCRGKIRSNRGSTASILPGSINSRTVRLAFSTLRNGAEESFSGRSRAAGFGLPEKATPKKSRTSRSCHSAP